MKILAKTISYLLHPLIVPTLGYLALFYSGYYFSMLSWDVKRFVLIAVFFTTGLLPVLTLSVMALSPNFNFKMDQPQNRIRPLLFSGIYYYIGFYLLHSITVYPVFRIFMITSIIVAVILLIISFRWKISIHMAAIGAVTGAILAVSFRMGMNPVILVVLLFLLAGILGSSRLYLGKHTLLQVLSGYALGLGVLYPAIYFI